MGLGARADMAWLGPTRGRRVMVVLRTPKPRGTPPRGRDSCHDLCLPLSLSLSLPAGREGPFVRPLPHLAAFRPQDDSAKAKAPLWKYSIFPLNRLFSLWHVNRLFLDSCPRDSKKMTSLLSCSSLLCLLYSRPPPPPRRSVYIELWAKVIGTELTPSSPGGARRGRGGRSALRSIAGSPRARPRPRH